MLVLNKENEIYERAIESHRRHNEIHGYEMHVLRRGVTKGYWNKFAYLLSLVVNELSKPEDKRTEWIMWCDASNLLLNPQIPLEAFLPPPDDQFNHVNFLGSTHAADLSTTAFFLRVSPWSVKLLVKAMALPMIDQSQDFGVNMDQASLGSVLNETDFRPSALYQPHSWYNTLQTSSGIQGKAGDLLIQFPASLEGARWKYLAEWLADLEAHPKKWSKAFKDTAYISEIESYWNRIRDVRGVLHDAEDKASQLNDDTPEALISAMEHVREVVAMEAWNEKLVQEAAARLRDAMSS
ncbi:glycosyltransferase family 34 protein [Lepidopterella palustris CBS 459.81]|uniref:Glycosyltransferase family 34 protein n=1 Tax=Lepidopterella palustris CBS 459.81 TaxID=1314670 RepID=A0A8E2JD31_9PEZI|nr:glycosyltransferase family 34 protein [Lepidopterella palustris CBS 459.81]